MGVSPAGAGPAGSGQGALMPRGHEYEIVVVGGGPAGLAAALAAVKAGAESVALIERRAEWGRPVRCAEYVPRMLARQIEIPPAAIARRVERMDFFENGKAIGSQRAPGFILHRDVFEAALAQRAAERGVAIYQPARAAAIHEDGRIALQPAGQSGPVGQVRPVRPVQCVQPVQPVQTSALAPRNEQFQTLRARFIIGADGPNSIVRRSLFHNRLRFAGALQWTMKAGEVPCEAEIHFAPEYGAGYAWCFPKGASVNVGLALHGHRKQYLEPLLRAFVAGLLRSGRISPGKASLAQTNAGKTAAGHVLRRTAGVIPVSGPISSAVHGRAILCGDAAGHAHPLTGAGIFTAISCGQMAGAVAAKALRRNDPSLLAMYDDQWQSLFSGFLTRGAKAVGSVETAGAEFWAGKIRRAWAIKPLG